MLTIDPSGCLNVCHPPAVGVVLFDMNPASSSALTASAGDFPLRLGSSEAAPFPPTPGLGASAGGTGLSAGGRAFPQVARAFPQVAVLAFQQVAVLALPQAETLAFLQVAVVLAVVLDLRLEGLRVARAPCSGVRCLLARRRGVRLESPVGRPAHPLPTPPVRRPYRRYQRKPLAWPLGYPAHMAVAIRRMCLTQVSRPTLTLTVSRSFVQQSCRNVAHCQPVRPSFSR